MKSYSSRELIKLLEIDGWVLTAIEGSHHQYKHPTKGGKITIPHPVKDVPIGTAKSILRMAGIK